MLYSSVFSFFFPLRVCVPHWFFDSALTCYPQWIAEWEIKHLGIETLSTSPHVQLNLTSEKIANLCIKHFLSCLNLKHSQHYSTDSSIMDATIPKGQTKCLTRKCLCTQTTTSTREKQYSTIVERMCCGLGPSQRNAGANPY